MIPKVDDMFDYMDQCFKDLDFPLIHTMNKEQIAELYSIPKRVFLLCFLLKKINEKLIESWLTVSLSKKEIDDRMAEVVQYAGFCTPSQSAAFISGALEKNEQIAILYRLCKWASLMQASKTDADTSDEFLSSTVDSDSMDSYSLDTVDMKAIDDFDLNLFPEHGPLQLLNRTTRRIKIDEYKKQLEELHLNLDECVRQSNDIAQQQVSDEESNAIHSESDFLKTIEVIKENLPTFKLNTYDVEKTRTVKTNAIVLNKKCDEILDECSQRLSNMMKHMENMNTILNFNENFLLIEPDCDNTLNGELLNMIEEIHSELSISKCH